MPVDPEVLRRLRERYEEIRRMPFFVLVWGPNPATNTPQSRKRARIREDLERIVGIGRVLFSEDPDLEELRRAGHFTAEWVQAEEADAVIIIAEREGALVESALYWEVLLGKAVVFTTRREPGFVETAYAALRVVTVEPEEWDACERVRHLARDHVERLRTLKYRTSHRRL